MQPIRFAGRYYDGRSSRAQPVAAQIDGGWLRLRHEDAQADSPPLREAPLASLQISERTAAAPRILRFDDGAFVESSEHAALDPALAAAGRGDGWVVRLQNRWRHALAALVATLLLLWLGYAYGLPIVAERIAYAVPVEAEAAIGQRAVEIVDRRLMSPTELPAARRQALAERFAGIAPPGARSYRIEFRRSLLGANALALPGGIIMVTDDLVKIAPGDDAILAVLAHELGHIERRHFLRRLISSAAIGAALTVIAGDASGLLSALPATVMELSYSREHELEADAYAVHLLREHGIDPEALAQALLALEAAHGGGPEDGAAKDGDRRGLRVSNYLSTHPATEARIAAIRAAR